MWDLGLNRLQASRFNFKANVQDSLIAKGLSVSVSVYLSVS